MTTNQNCKYTEPGYKLPCDIETRQCPLEDHGFISALKYYIYGVNPLPSITGKFLNIRDGIYECRSDIEPVDIEILWGDIDWTPAFHEFFKSGIVSGLNRNFCDEIRAARTRWYRRLAPLTYQWLGPAIEKPDRLKYYPEVEALTC